MIITLTPKEGEEQEINKMIWGGSEVPQPTKNWEEVLVNNFLVKEIRERSLFELRSKNKRKRFFGRVAFIPNYVIEIPKFHPNEEVSALMETLKKFGAKDNCYAMSTSNEHDKKFFSLREGVDMIYNNYALTDILIFTENLAVFLSESGEHRPSRFIIYRGDVSGSP